MIHQDRIQKAQQRMQEKGIDAYLILTHDDYIYLFGEDRSQPRAVLPAKGAPVIVVFRAEEEEIKKSFKLDDVRIMSSLGEQIKDIIGVMEELRGGRETLTVGVQMWFSTPAFMLNMFQKANPKVKVADIAPVMDALRMEKSEEEIRLMKRAGEIADIGMETAARIMKPGISENEVAGEVEYAMRKAGGHGTATPVYVNSGYRSCWLHGAATDKKIEEGELIVIDLVPRFNGYCANLCRTFILGAPSPKQKELFEVYQKVQTAGKNLLKPGTIIREIDSAAKKIIDEAGYGEFYVAGISHSIGLGFEETPAPTIHPGDSRIPLKAGMTVTVGHTVLAVPGIGGVRLEDTFHISKDGVVPLTHFYSNWVLPLPS